MTKSQLASSQRREWAFDCESSRGIEDTIQHCATWFTPKKRSTSSARPYDLADDLVIYWHFCAKLGVNG